MSPSNNTFHSIETSDGHTTDNYIRSDSKSNKQNL